MIALSEKDQMDLPDELSGTHPSRSIPESARVGSDYMFESNTSESGGTSRKSPKTGDDYVR